MPLGVLGPLVLQVDGRQVEPRGRRARDILAVLLLRRGHDVPSDVLLDLVWGTEATSLSVGVVHTAVARLRRTVGPDLVETTDLGYRVPVSVATDADAFSELVRRARESVAAGESAEAVARFRQALAIWRGAVAYDGVSDELVVADRVRLDELRCSAVEDLAAALLDCASDDGPDALPAAQEAWELTNDLMLTHPLRERAHGLGMLASARLGRQAQALEVYQHLYRRLQDELGIEPGAETMRIHAAVLAQETWHTATTPRPVAAAGWNPLGVLAASTLPVPATPTIGRDGLVAEVLAAVSSGQRLVTLVGPGGVGKSRLLSVVGASLPSSTRRTYLDLSGTGSVDADQLAEAVAVAYGLGTPVGDPVGGLVRLLRPSTSVVLVDEAEWVLDAAGEVLRALLDGCPGLSFVVTSRVALGVLGERLVPVPPLGTPAIDATADDVARAPAVTLLRERLADRGVPVAAQRDADVLLAEMARRVDGLPLALELLAGHGSLRTLPELRDLVESPLDLEAVTADHVPRQRSLRETLLWSVERLGPDQRTLLCRLAVFVGPFDLAAARAVVGTGSGDVEAGVRTLVTEGLVQVDRRASRYRLRLLRTVRDLGLESLAADGALAELRRRHREWFARRWRGCPLEDQLVADVGDSYDDYLEALRSSLSERDATTAGDLLLTLCRLWQFIETPAPALRWIEQVLDSSLLTAAQRGQVMVARAGLMLQSSTDDGLDEAEVQLDHDPDWLGLLHLVRSIERYASGDFAGAEPEAIRAVQLGRTTAPHHLPEALAVLAAVRAAQTRPGPALLAAEESWTLVRSAPTGTQLTSVVPKIALALTDSGEPARALEVLEEAMTGVGAQLGLRPTHTMLVNAGWAALGAGDPLPALRWFARALTDPTGLPEGVALAENLCGAGCALDALDDPAAAEVLVAALELSERTSFAPSPWQRAQMAPALARLEVPASDPLPESDDALAERVTELVRARNR